MSTGLQLGLFSLSPRQPPRDAAVSLSRRSDPATSRLAASETVESGRLGVQKAAVLAALREHTGSTSAELAQRSGLDRYLVARRLPDLRRDGLVVAGQARHCMASGRLAVTWGLP